MVGDCLLYMYSGWVERFTLMHTRSSKCELRREREGERWDQASICVHLFLCTSLSLHSESRECITAQKVPLGHCMNDR